MNHLKRWLREPLLHFLLIGIALFLVFHLLEGRGGDNPNRIVVSSGQVEQLVATFSRSWQRPPNPEEKAGLIDNLIRDEVYYREALLMGLDQDDPFIRRRLRQKLEFLLEEVSFTGTPTDAALTAFMQTHENRYRQEAKVSFRQIFLNPDKRQNAAEDARAILDQVRSGTDPDSLGDPILVGHQFESATKAEVAGVFGPSFTREVLKLKPGEWAGPVRSGLGLHLVLVRERMDARLPELDAVRARVEEDWRNQQQEEQKEAAFRKLRERYEIVIEPPVEEGNTSRLARVNEPTETNPQ